LPPHASPHNPIDTTAGIDAATYGACLDAVLTDDTVHAVIAIAAPTALSDPTAVIAEATARAHGTGITTPVLAVRLTQPQPSNTLRTETTRPVPSYADPALAGDALAHAIHYGQWRARPTPPLPDLPAIEPQRARTLGRQVVT